MLSLRWNILRLRLLFFLLTHLLRGVTIRSWVTWPVHMFLLTHLLRGVTTSGVFLPTHWKFLLTHLLRGVTICGLVLAALEEVSTHTPLARCDRPNPETDIPRFRFYSHTSCEV